MDKVVFAEELGAQGIQKYLDVEKEKFKQINTQMQQLMKRLSHVPYTAWEQDLEKLNQLNAQLPDVLKKMINYRNQIKGVQQQ